MCKFRPGSGNFLGFSGKTKENVRKTRTNLRNRGSKFLISYFLLEKRRKTNEKRRKNEENHRSKYMFYYFSYFFTIFLNPTFKLVKYLNSFFNLTGFSSFLDQNLAIYTVFYKESESEVKKIKILEPGGKNWKNQ